MNDLFTPQKRLVSYIFRFLRISNGFLHLFLFMMKTHSDRAFAGCTKLSEIYILNTTLEIPDHTFDGTSTKIYGYADSTAEMFANEHGMTFVSLGNSYHDMQVVFNGPKRISLGDSIELELKVTRNDDTTETIIDGFNILYDSNYEGLHIGYVVFDYHYVPFEFYVDTPEISSLFINDSSVQLRIGDRYEPEVFCHPYNALLDYFNLSADDETVVSIEDNEITALKEGVAVITVSSPDGAVTSEFTVEVSNSVPIDCSDGVEDTFVFVAPDTANYCFTVTSNNATGTVYLDDGEEKAFNREDNSISFFKAFEKDEICLISIYDEENREIIITQTENQIMLGDVDSDGGVTIIDATFIQRKLASIPIPFEFNEVIADADEDKSVTIIDATCIQRWLVNLPTNDRIGKPIS